jgi:hypothetical protein
MTKYSIRGLVASVPVPFDRTKTTDGYQILVSRDEVGAFRRNGFVYRRAGSDSAEARELQRIRHLPSRVRHKLERLVAYCPSGCPMIVVYVFNEQLYVHLAGTVVAGAGGQDSDCAMQTRS